MPKKILIVDDDRLFCDALASCLEAEGHNVEYAFDGSRGEELAGSGRHDLVLLDVKMPNANGLDVLRRIKELKPETPVFLITGWMLIDQLIAAENAASLVSGLFKKPFHVERLIEKIATL